MVMYDDEFETKEKKLNKGYKIKPWYKYYRQSKWTHASSLPLQVIDSFIL